MNREREQRQNRNNRRQHREEEPRSEFEILGDQIKNYLEELKQEYQQYINILHGSFKNVIDDFINSFNNSDGVGMFVNLNLFQYSQPLTLSQELSQGFIAANIFNQIIEDVKNFFKTMLAEFLVSDSSILDDEEKKQQVINFIKKELSILDLVRLINLFNQTDQPGYIGFQSLNNDYVNNFFKSYNIQDYWKNFLITTLTERIKDKKTLEEYLESVLKIYQKNVEILKENLLKSDWVREIAKDEFRRRRHREPNEEELEKEIERKVDEIIDGLKEAGEIDVDTLMKAKHEDLNEMLEFFKSFNKEMEEVKNGGKKFDFKKFWENWSGKLKDILTTIGVGAALWGVLFAFLLPVYFVEKVRKEIEKIK